MDVNQESILGTFLPNVYISKISLNDERVEISLLIKENIDDDEELTSLNSDFLKEFVKISVLQSADEASTEKLADNFLFEKDKIDLNVKRVDITLESSNKSKTSIDENGNREIYYDCIFVLDTKELEHLSYFVFCEIDEEHIRKKFKLKSTVKLNYSPNKVSNEIVIEKGNVTEESYVYILPDETIWPGAIRERNNNEYFTYNFKHR